MTTNLYPDTKSCPDCVRCDGATTMCELHQQQTHRGLLLEYAQRLAGAINFAGYQELMPSIEALRSECSVRSECNPIAEQGCGWNAADPDARRFDRIYHMVGGLNEFIVQLVYEVNTATGVDVWRDVRPEG